MKTPPFSQLSHVVVGLGWVVSSLDAAILTVVESGLGSDAAAVVASGFAEDVPAYSDRAHQHNGAAFNGNTLATNGATVVPLPAYLVGGDYVRFANNARENPGYSATVETDVVSDFYLLIDNRLHGPAGTGSSANTTDPVLGGTLQWVLDGGWQRVNTGISPGVGPDYTGLDEGGDGTGPGQGLNQFFAVYRSAASATSVTVYGPQIAGNNMIALVAVPDDSGGGPDSDGDGLPDAWEMLHFQDLDELDSDDFDDDGLTNLEEFNLGANPTVKDSDGDGLEDGAEFHLHGTDPAVADTDGDGLGDGDEVITYLTDPTSPDTDGDGLTDFAEVMLHFTDPNAADSDGDGFGDAVEVAAGSDPNDGGSVPSFGQLDGVLINEFMASNQSTLADGDGEYGDWIELWNPTGAAVDLAGWHLSDDPLNLEKWTFPARTLAPGAFLIVFASGKDRGEAGSELHTNFRLDRAAGSFLALSRPDGQGGLAIVSQFNPYGRQEEDVSFGYYGTLPPLPSGYFQTPTPGAANTTGAVQGFVADTTFSVDRGYYDAPFDVVIRSATPGATILFTTDGSLPSESPPHGTSVAAPDAATPPAATVNIATTTQLRAIAVKPGFEPTNVDTQTYVFAADVLQQGTPAQPFAPWGHSGADWAMDPDVRNHASPESRVVPDDLKSIPTVSLSLPFSDFWGPGGIYIAGEGVPRNCSIEFLNPLGLPADPNTEPGFQVDGTVQIAGGSSTGRWKTDKLSMRLKFRPDLRANVFGYPGVPFGDGAVERFDTLVLDARLNNVWTHPDASQNIKGQYVRDQYMADLQNALGGTAPRGRHVHLFVSGLYWGLHTLHERPDDNFAAAYLGGDNTDYDAIKHRTGTVLQGSNSDYLALASLLDQNMADPANYAAARAKLDVEDFAHYMLVNYWAGNTDWSHQNWYATRNRVDPDGRWRFHSWDAEHVLKNVNENVTSRNDANSPTEFHNQLMGSPEYQLVFADAVRRAFFNGGALTPANAAAAYNARIAMIDRAIRCESARWGDNRKAIPYLRGVEWMNELNNLRNNYFPNRTTIVLAQFVSRGWYPATDAPVFAPHGGRVPRNTALTITSPDGGTIHYTSDGSDPRLPASGGGDATLELVPEHAEKFALMPTDPSMDTTWMLTDFDHAGWPSGTLGAGYEASSLGTFDPYLDPAHDFGDVVTSNINETIFVRIPFAVTGVANLGSMTLRVRYDDGFVAYLNGTEVRRVNAPGSAGTPPAYNAGASASHSDALAVQWEAFDLGAHVGLLRNGANLLALHGLNQGTGGSDMLVWATLEASETPSGGGAVSPAAAPYTGPLILTESATVRARVLNGGEWSALTEAHFIVGTVPADASNLVVSEINYHPSPPTPAEAAAGHTNAVDFEFIELLNIGPDPLDLSGVAFVAGLDFQFDTDATIAELAPGGRLLVVGNAEAFALRHGTGLPVAGVFQNGTRLDNAGETLTLRNALLPAPADQIRSFAYDNGFPWPDAADGEGFTLTLVAPHFNPDHAQPGNWRASVAPGGSPGGSDSLPFEAWSAPYGGLDPLDDDDGDGDANLFDYAMLGSPTVAGDTRATVEEEAGVLVVRYRRNKSADDVVLEAEASSDLQAWVGAPITDVRDNGDGSETVTARVPYSPLDPSRRFVRLCATLRP